MRAKSGTSARGRTSQLPQGIYLSAGLPRPTGLACEPTQSMMGRASHYTSGPKTRRPEKGRLIHGRSFMRLSKFLLTLSLLLASGVAEAQVKFAYVGEISGSIA